MDNDRETPESKLTATIAMLTTLIPATMVTVIATAMAANRNGYLIVTAVTAA